MATLAAQPPAVDHLESELAWLDEILRAAVARQRTEGRWRGEDDLRGVYTSGELAASVLAGRSAPLEMFPEPEAPSLECRNGDAPPPLEHVYRAFGLGRFERFALLLALAPELDARYRTLFGFLHDDVSAGAPTIGLALDLWAGAGPRSAPLRGAFHAQGALVRFGLVRLRALAGSSSLLRTGLEVDDWLVARVLGEDAPGPHDGRLTVEGPVAPVAPVAPGRPFDPEPSPLAIDPQPWPLVVQCADRRAGLDEASTAVGRRLLTVDLAQAQAPEEILLVATRRARLDGLALVLTARDLRTDAASLTAWVSAVTDAQLPVVVLAGAEDADLLPDRWPRRRVGAVTVAQRCDRWRTGLTDAGVEFGPGAIDAVASSHPIALDRIDAAVTRVARDPVHQPRSAADLRAAARSVVLHGLGGLARRVAQGRRWSDLVLPAETMRRLREISQAVSNRPRVLEQWGFGGRPGGRGMHVLFSGPSGTGKTLAASVIADEAGYSLYAVDLARVVDKYLGETEKQLDRLFDEASAAGAMLLFDEADALFGQRAEVHDARDRYANVEIAYLLQRLDAHEGITILATNLPHHLDQAFARRLHHRVEFPMPDAALRRRLWLASLPDGAPVSPELEVEVVASRFELAGGAIRNAALTAGYLAAASEGPISMRDVVRAIARELEKSGHPATRAEFRELHGLLADPE